MQMHPHEAWDLLELLGLPGRWGESAAPFVRYFSQLREAFPERDWAFLQGMSADFFADPEARADPELEADLRRALKIAGSGPIRKFAELGLTSAHAAELSPEKRGWMDEWLRRHTPMRERVFRSTVTSCASTRCRACCPPR